MTEKFLRCIGFVLSHEGGYSHDPDDPGGETRWGISKRTYPNVDIRNLSRTQAMELYFADWWLRYNYEAIDNEEIAKRVFDFAVNAGQSVSVKRLQMALNVWNHALDVDGKMGPKTLLAVNVVSNPDALLKAFTHFRASFYESLNREKYIRGWLLRAFA